MSDPRWWRCAACEVQWKDTTSVCWMCDLDVATPSYPPTFGFSGMALAFR